MFDDFQEFDEQNTFVPQEPEGLQLPRNSTLCLGHDGPEKVLINLLNSGSFPHALIFAGEKGIGKSTMAFRLARFMLKNGTGQNAQDSLFGDAPEKINTLDISAGDPVFHRVSSGGHPDLLTIERATDSKGEQKNNLDVDTARKIAPFVRLTASDGGWRIVIVDDADTMNRNAQNAILKILEEPPTNTLLILICHRLGAMIPTIRSRCRVIHFDPLDDETIGALMEKEIGETISSYDRQTIAALSGGSIGIARTILESDGMETIRSVMDIFKNWPDFNQVKIHHLSESAGKLGRAGVIDNIERFFIFLCEQMVFNKAKNHTGLKLPLDDECFQKLFNRYTLEEWIEKTQALQNHFSQSKFSNLDPRITVINAFGYF